MLMLVVKLIFHTYLFSATQAMAMKYGSSVSSIGGSTISMPESLKGAGFPSAQPTQQPLSGTSVTTGPTVPQHLAVHPYNQPPLGPFANMIGYPFFASELYIYAICIPATICW